MLAGQLHFIVNVKKLADIWSPLATVFKMPVLSLAPSSGIKKIQRSRHLKLLLFIVCLLCVLQFLRHPQTPQSLRSCLRACCPTSRAFLSPTSPPPCRLVCLCVRSTQGWHFLYHRAARVDCSSPPDTDRTAERCMRWWNEPFSLVEHFCLRRQTIDLFCLLIFIASQDSTTALPVSSISYSLSFSPSPSFRSSTPLNSISASHLRVHPLRLSPSYLSPPLCHLPSLSVRCCVPRVSALCISDGWPFLVWRLLSLLSMWAALHVCVFSIMSSFLPPWEENVQTISFCCCCVYFVSHGGAGLCLCCCLTTSNQNIDAVNLCF